MPAARVTLPRRDLEFVLEALESADAELAALEISKDWFASDSRDRLESARQILHTELDIKEREYHEEIEQDSPELCFDE